MPLSAFCTQITLCNFSSKCNYEFENMAKKFTFVAKSVNQAEKPLIQFMFTWTYLHEITRPKIW